MTDTYLFPLSTTRSLFDPSTEPLDTFSCSLLAVVKVAGTEAPSSLLLLPEYPDL